MPRARHPTSPPLSVRERRATAAVAVQFAINGALFASYLPRLPELRDTIGVGTTAIGVLLTVASTSGLLASWTVRAILSRFGTRRVLLGAGIAIAASLLAVGVAPSWPVALVGLFAMFFFDVYVDVAMNLQGSHLSARRARPIMNRLHGLWSLGAVLGGLVAARLAARGVSLTVHLVAVALVLAVLSSVVATQLLPTDPQPPAHGASGRGSPPAVRRRRFAIAGLTAVLIESAALGWAAFRISDDLHGSASAAALASVAVVAGMTIGRIAGDHLAQALGQVRLTFASAVLATAGILLAAVASVDGVVVAAFLLAGLGVAAMAPRLYDLAAQAGGGTAAGLGALTAGIRAATIITPVAIAGLAAISSVGMALAVAAVVGGLGFAAAVHGIDAAPSAPRDA